MPAVYFVCLCVYHNVNSTAKQARVTKPGTEYSILRPRLCDVSHFGDEKEHILTLQLGDIMSPSDENLSPSD